MPLSPQSQRFYFLAFVLAVIYLLYAPTLSFQFTNWDDNHLLTENPLVRYLTPENVKKIFQTPFLGTYVPLTILSFTLEYHWAGGQPFIYHLDNLLLHLGVTALVFVLASRLGFSLWATVISALIFGIHPLHVESVAWITERKDVLYSLLFLFSLLAYDVYLETGRRRLFLSALVLAVASMLAKPMAVSIPLIWLLWDWYRRRRLSGQVFVEKVILGAFLFPLALVTLRASEDIINGVTRLKWADGVIVYLWNLTFYITKFFYPYHLSPIYEPPSPVALTNGHYLGSVLFFFGILSLLVSNRSQRCFLFAFLFYVFSILPVLRFGKMYVVGMVADRFMYLPSFGLCLLAGYLIDELRVRVKQKGTLWYTGYWASVFFLGVILVNSTWRQTRIWENGNTLWESVLKDRPHNITANINLADYLLKQGLATEKVVGLCRRVLASDPSFAPAHTNLSNALAQLGRFDEAIFHARQAIRLKPEEGVAYNNLGAALKEQGKYDEAIFYFQQALARNYAHAGVYYNLGVAQALSRDPKAAQASFEKSLAVDPGYQPARHDLIRIKILTERSAQ